MPVTLKQLLDSTKQAGKILYGLKPVRNQQEFEHYKLMEDIRIHYLTYEEIEKLVNADGFTPAQLPGILIQLKNLMIEGAQLDQRFNALNKDYLYPSELAQENELRDAKARLLYQRLSRTK